MTVPAQRFRRPSWVLLTWIGLICLPAHSFAASSEPARDSGREITYRLIHAPLEKIFDLTKGKEEYRKMNRDDFFAQVRALQQALPRSVASGVSIRAATYTARLEGTALVEGQAVLEIESLT